MRTRPLHLLLAMSASAAWAQPPVSDAPASTAIEPKVERAVLQEGYTRIEELRIGGQTRSIDVQTRSAVPGYEVRPIDPALPNERSGAGTRRWRVLRF
jgi:hypothetical protein